MFNKTFKLTSFFMLSFLFLQTGILNAQNSVRDIKPIQLASTLIAESYKRTKLNVQDGGITLFYQYQCPGGIKRAITSGKVWASIKLEPKTSGSALIKLHGPSGIGEKPFNLLAEPDFKLHAYQGTMKNCIPIKNITKDLPQATFSSYFGYSMDVEAGKTYFVVIIGDRGDSNENSNYSTFYQIKSAEVQYPGIGPGSYYINSTYSDKVVEVSDYGTKNGDNIQQWEKTGTKSQQWNVAYAPNTNKAYFTIKNWGSGKCLDISEYGKNNGVNVHQWDCLGTDNQWWWFKDVGNNEVQIVSASKDNFVLDISRSPYATGAKANGDNVQMYEGGTNENQRFQLLPVYSMPEDEGPH